MIQIICKSVTHGQARLYLTSRDQLLFVELTKLSG